MKKKILSLLTNNPQMSKKSVAQILGISEAQVKAEIAKLIASGDIIGFKTVLNSNKRAGEEVTALIEVRAKTQRGSGFDEVAYRIARFPEVVDLYLISGNHDFNILVRGKTVQDIANFVSSKVAVLENVQGTTTHFLLKKYKEGGLIFDEKKSDKRLKVSA
jgi:DNA-binding Lrp family transcriptional regulator